MYAARLGVDPMALAAHMWGDFNWNPKSKAFEACASGGKPLAVSLMLDRIWAAYDALYLNYDPVRVDKMVQVLQLPVPPRDIASRDVRTRVSSLLRTWLPLHSCICRSLLRVCPSPVQVAARVAVLWPVSPPHDDPRNALRAAVAACDATSTDTCVYVSKMCVAPRAGDSDAPDDFIALARVYCGTLTPSSKVYVLGPRHVSSSSGEGIPCVTGLKLCLMMGGDGPMLPYVSAGHVCGIMGLSDHVAKCATLCSTPIADSMAGMTYQSTPLVKVSLQPDDARHVTALQRGLDRLNASDACVEVSLNDSGEMLLAACGELHLQRCIHDLRTRFAKVPFTVSEPLVSFCETVSTPTRCEPQPYSVLGIPIPVSDSPPDAGVALTADGVWAVSHGVRLRLSARPMPPAAVSYLDSNSAAIERVYNSASDDTTPCAALRDMISPASALLRTAGPNACISTATGVTLHDGPATVSLPNALRDLCAPRVEVIEPLPPHVAAALTSLSSSITLAFTLTAATGPLAGEALRGVVIVFEELHVAATCEDGATGVPIALLRDAMRMSVECATPRLVEPVLSCALSCVSGRAGAAAGESLGALYACLHRRRGRVVAEEMSETAGSAHISAMLPVAASFGFADDLRSSTSGAASTPTLVWSHWEVMDADVTGPPGTLPASAAREYVAAVRARKGMPSDKKIVVHAEKQRNLARKK